MSLKLTRYNPNFWSKWPSLLLDDSDDLWPTMSNDLHVYETDEEVVVEAKVPGVSKDEIDIDYQNRTLVIKASHEESEEEKKKKKVVYKSTSSNSYAYSTTIPCPVDSSAIKAELEKGVLKIVLPKSAEAKPKKIKVIGK
ncbi:hypothetical protein DRH14_04550 [Candidatus Shapirobacteria bacterium]|nr:MAG: hypothetical protein DRH14_04550 [Candidatus Shapirobacteria bacterium]